MFSEFCRQKKPIDANSILSKKRCIDVFSLFLIKRAKLFKLPFAHAVLHKFKLKYSCQIDALCSFFTKQLYFNQSHGCRGCFVEVCPKTANRCFLLVFDKMSQFEQIYICASSNRELSCQIDALCTFFYKKTLISSKVTVADTVLYNFHIKQCIDVLWLFLTNKPI